MNRRLLLSAMGLAPFTLISAKIPIHSFVSDNPIIENLIKRWKKSKEYTSLVLDAMPKEKLEYSPSDELMSFAQHFMHLGFTNNAFIGTLVDSNTYPDFETMLTADFFLDRPDKINLFQPDSLEKRDAKENKRLVSQYVNDTFDFVISSLDGLSDELLTKGEGKEKPWYLAGHTNLDLILRAESHTAHHRAQAITYLRLNGIRPPGYSRNNTF